MISIIILTKNEEYDLPSCINAVTWCDDIHVVDSGSSDKTIEIAYQLGAKVCVNTFESFAQQRNWALDNCNTKYEWILFLDADEHSTVAFQNALEDAVLHASEDVAGFFCCGKTMLNQRWLKRSDNFPKWQFRLLRKNSSRFIDIGHGQKEGKVNGRLGYIKEPYLHFAFSHGFEAWRTKHLTYAKKDSKEIFKSRISFLSLISRHSSKRNTALRFLARRMPAWPLVRFFYSYLLRGGFTEGKEGLLYCQKMVWYERQVSQQLRLLNNSQKSIGHRFR